MKSLAVSLKEMEQLAGEFTGRLLPKKDRATVVTLSGDLGSGKTTFAKALARTFGIEEDVTSPTYVIEKIYIPTKGLFSRLIHIDAYRLKDKHDLDVLGWYELLQAPGNLILLEWPEKVEGAIPSDAIRVSLEFVDEHTRAIKYDLE